MRRNGIETSDDNSAPRPACRAGSPMGEPNSSRARPLRDVAIVTASVYLGQGAVAPVLPQIADDFRLSVVTAGFVFSSFALARLFLNVPFGFLSDRYGRRRMMIAGPLLAGIGLIGSGLSGSFIPLLTMRIVGGAGSAMYMTAAEAYLADITTSGNRARFIGVNQGALLVGASISPGLAGVLAQWIGWHRALVAMGVISVSGAVLAVARLREPDTATAAARAMSTGTSSALGGMFKRPEFMAVWLITFATFFTRSGSRNTILPFVSEIRLDMSPGTLGLVLTGMMVVQGSLIIPASRWADTYGRRRVILVGVAVAAIGPMMFAAAEAYPLFLAAAFLLASGEAIGGPASAAYVADITPTTSRGLAMGVNRTMGDLGFILGPLVLGYVADTAGFASAFVANGGLLAAVGILFYRFARKEAT